MKLVLAIALCIVPVFVNGQEWRVLGLPRGAASGMVVASDTVMYYPYGHLYRQGADRKWRQQREIGPIRDIEAWGDTVMLLTPSALEMSVDAGMTWRTADAESFNVIMPGTERVIKFSNTTKTTIGVTICEPFSGVCVETTMPRGTFSFQTYESNGLIGVYNGTGDVRMLSLLYMPSLDTTTWRREDRVITSMPIRTVGGGITYFRDSSLIYIRSTGEDTLRLRGDMVRKNADYQLCRYAGGWVLRTVAVGDAQFFRSNDGDSWQDVTQLLPSYNCRMSGVQGNDIIITTDEAGPYRMDINTGVITMDVVGLGHRSEMFTDGRYVVVYDHERDRNLVILEDTPDGARLLFDTVLTSEITSAYLIGDSAWVVADSVYTIDLATGTWTNENFAMDPAQRGGTGVAALPSGIGIYHGRSVFYRQYSTSTWNRIDANQTMKADPEVFIGTDDGFMLITSESENYYSEYLHALRFTMSGEMIGMPSKIGDLFPDMTQGRRALRRMGSNYFFTTNHRAGFLSTDVGRTWLSLSAADDIAITPTALWWNYTLAYDELTKFTNDLGASWKFVDMPEPSTYEIDQLFCLDHHCYAMGREGVMTTPRPTVSVQDSSESPQSRLVGESAVVYNGLGEIVATLPIIDGVLAPYEMSMLPMQPLWAVAGGVAIRIR